MVLIGIAVFTLLLYICRYVIVKFLETEQITTYENSEESSLEIDEIQINGQIKKAVL